MRLVPFEDLAPVYGITYTRQHLSRLEREGKFPRKVVKSRDRNGNPRRVGWVDKEIEAHNAQLVAHRDQDTP